MTRRDAKEQKLEADKRKPSSAWRKLWLVGGWVGIAICATALAVTSLVLYKTAPPTVHTNPDVAGRVEETLQQAQATAGRGAVQILRIDETELNSIVDSHLARRLSTAPQNAEASLRDVKMNLIDDRLHVYVVLNLRGKDFTIDLEGAVHTENGYMRFDPISGRIGALPIPRSMLQSAAREIANSLENREDLRLPDYLKDLRVEGGKIVLTYR